MNSVVASSGRWARPVAVTLLWLETAVLAVAAVAYAIHGVAGSSDVELSFALAAMVAVLAVPLGAAGRAVAKGKRWGRSYGLMWQVLQVAVGWYVMSASPLLGIGVMALAIAAAAAIVLDTRLDPQI
ncbi:MAG: hypothetical protein ACK5IM_03125 [Demequina sp.]|uniref:hypothetical protein n=1 Tax=Demequina sp. TaxID=2050685 RepID=UPI003A88F340